MSGRIPKQFIDDLLLRVDIVDLIDSHLPLKKTGGNFVARCPFHTEKTPSFNVNRNRQIFHCFGCGASGNAISFLMDFSHLDFVEAVEDLAAFVGVEVPKAATDKADYASKQDNSHIYQALEDASAFYTAQLRSPEGKKAVEYLKRRGVSAEIARRYSLGYAPDKWDALLNRYDQKTLLEAGLLVSRDDGKTYDRFRNRLMFPIRDKRKRVIGFGGRVLDDSLPKYLNSPETAAFSKGKELYGLCELLENHSRPAQILIVEGYMDVIALAQFGVDNAVAALGTATSKAHLDLLFRFAPELVFCFDGDSAGRQAAWKATETALPCLRDGRQIKIMLLPQTQDPDTLIRAEGITAFKERIVNAHVLSDYFFEQSSSSLNLNTVEGRSQLLAAAKPQLEKMPGGFFRDMMLARLEELSGIRFLKADRPKTPAQSIKRPIVLQKSNLMRRIVALLLQFPHLARHIEQHAGFVAALDMPGTELLRDVLTVIAGAKPENSAVLLESYRDSAHAKAVTALSNLVLDIPEGGEENEFRGALNQLLKQEREKRMSALIDKVSRGEPLSADETAEYKTGGKL
ncbi:MAG: DNA primase [Methylococcales bacterium]|nr:DNA primase [Methylococcales bacterium]